MRIRKTGTFTLGGFLIAFGILFLLRIFIDTISYDIIFKLWPVIFISLGIEILISNIRLKIDNSMVYDKTAIVLIVILSFFAMAMSVAQLCMEYAANHVQVY